MLKTAFARAAKFVNLSRFFGSRPSCYLEAEPWVLDRLEFTDDKITIGGWALPPKSKNTPVSFKINGQPFDKVDYPRPIPSFEQSFWMRPGAEASGFSAERRQSRAKLFRDGHLSMSFDFPGRPSVGDYHSSWYYPDPSWALALPEVERRYRVIGSDSVEMFSLGGFTDFQRMNLLLQDRFQFGYRDCQRILDWGCGCGRVARYFARVPETEFHGGDIDPNNIAWCRDNLTFGKFHHLPLRPKTSFPDASFDLIYGISVFTHLREDVQFAWLQELKRILKPGGVALVTMHGPTTMNYAMMPSEAYQSVTQRIDREGFVVTASNPQINDVIDDKEYYVNVAHSSRYVRKEWGRYFQVLDIIPGFIWTHDLVVLRKKR